MGVVAIMVDLAKGGFREWYKTATFRLENMWVHLYEAHDACYCAIKTLLCATVVLVLTGRK